MTISYTFFSFMYNKFYQEIGVFMYFAINVDYVLMTETAPGMTILTGSE